MDTRHPSRAIRLTVDERMVLRRLVEINATGVWEAIQHAKNVDDLDAAIDAARAHNHMRRAVETGIAEVDDGLRAAAQLERERTTEWLHEQRATLARVRRKDAGAKYVGMTFEESEAETVRYIDQGLDELNLCERLLNAGAS